MIFTQMSITSFHRFEDLREKTVYIIGENSNDEAINKTLKDIGRYSTIDSKTFPSAKVRNI